MAEAGVAATPLFKKKGGGKRDRDVRARDSAVAGPSSGTPGDGGSAISGVEESSSSVVLKKRKAGGGNPLLQAATGFAKRSKADRADGDDDENDDDYGLDRYGESSVSSVVRSSASDGKQSLSNRQDATRESDWYDERRSTNSSDRINDAATSGNNNNNNDDGVYRGASSYNTFITPRDDGTSSKLKAATKGPVKGGNNVRTITVVDYQPDVCKDYKETGYCGFGDTCKFMHDRSDYLAGWQLDSLPNSAARQVVDDEDDDADEEIPFACLICRKPFTDPIITKCGHYFCSACAIKRFSKTSKCFACGKQTQGIFNSAAKVLERMEKARKVKEEEREQRRWNRGQGEEESTSAIQQSGEIIDGVEIGRAEEEE